MNTGNDEIPNVVINGLDAVSKVQKVISKRIEFGFNDLDQADELRSAIQVIQQDLANYNQVLREHQVRQQQMTQETEVAEDSERVENAEGDEEK